MKALSVRQPWAWAIVHGQKKVENRSRPTQHRGQLVIHASKSRRAVRPHYTGLVPAPSSPSELVYGALVGVVDLIDCRPLAQCPIREYAVGPWCWLLVNSRAFRRPIPWRGCVTLFPVPEEVIRAALDS